MNKRNIGLDILRSISMLMIVAVHYLGKGGILWNGVNNPAMDAVAWILDALCLVCVNCYVLSSAYFLSASDKGIRWSKVVELLGAMCFYSWLVGVVLVVTGVYKCGLMDLICTTFPFLTKNYWFINVYILMYLLHPYLNKMLGALTQKEHKLLLAIGLVFFCVMPSVIPLKTWLIDKTGAYGIIWFFVLYITGAYIRKYGFDLKKPVALTGFFVSGIACYLARMAIIFVANKIGKGREYAEIWYSFDSIPMYLGSVCLFGFFVNWKSMSKAAEKIIRFFAAGTLGVYLFHEQHLLRQILWDDILRVPDYHNSWMMFVYMIPVVLGIFLIGVLIDHGRIQLFKAAKRLKK